MKSNMSSVVMEMSPTRYFKSKKIHERVLSWSLSTATAFCFLVGIAWAYSMRMSVDPSFILAPALSLQKPMDMQYNKGLNGTSLEGQQPLNHSDVSDLSPTGPTGPTGHNVLDDKYFIRQTALKGKDAVERFQSRAACLSSAGRWVYDPTPRKLPWLAVLNYNWIQKCDKEHTKHGGGVWGDRADSIASSNSTDSGTWSVREELKWVWRTNDSSCPWYPMDRDDFCRRIGSNNNVLVVGDSISHEISVAIQNTLALNSSSAFTQKKYPGEELCSDVLGGVGKGITVNFLRNDYLTAVVNSTNVGRNFQDPWMPHLDNGDGDIKILFINRGAHYQKDHKFVYDLRETFTILRDRHPELLVIYRNTPTGHVNCTQFHAPLAMPLKGAPASFHWEDFDRQNELAKQIVEEFHYIYIDVARPIGMRPEGHMHGHDCLHYCQPGPLDLAVEMFYNVLKLLP